MWPRLGQLIEQHVTIEESLGRAKTKTQVLMFNWNTSLMESPQLHEGSGISLQVYGVQELGRKSISNRSEFVLEETYMKKNKSPELLVEGVEILVYTVHSTSTHAGEWGNITNLSAHPQEHRPCGMGGGGGRQCLKLLAHPPHGRCSPPHGAPAGAHSCFLVGNN